MEDILAEYFRLIMHPAHFMILVVPLTTKLRVYEAAYFLTLFL